MAAVDQERLFNSSEYTKLREAWCAAMLGLGYERYIGPCRTAVNESPHSIDADLFLETAGVEYPFQLVEAMVEGRRRGAEYKELAREGGLRYFGNDAGQGRIDGPRWIADAIARKAEKRYAGAADLNLLVYANFNSAQLQYDDVELAARPHVSGFASVWVVSSTAICTLSVSNGLGKIVGGWGVIFTPEQYLADEAG